jgi:hypothetical protein
MKGFVFAFKLIASKSESNRKYASCLRQQISP